MNTTKTAQFTPGPWYPHLAKADHCLSSSVWGAEPGNQVAVIGGKSLQTMNANATLIAAAPAMYEALQQSLVLVELAALEEWGRAVRGEQQPPTTEAKDRLEKVKAALAQAEGTL